MSRRVDCSRNLLAEDCTEERDDRSASRKVSFTPGAVSLTFEMSSEALEALRPLKKMWDGFLAAMKDMKPAPRPVVPGEVSYVWYSVVLMCTSCDEDDSARLIWDVLDRVE